MKRFFLQSTKRLKSIIHIERSCAFFLIRRSYGVYKKDIKAFVLVFTKVY